MRPDTQFSHESPGSVGWGRRGVLDGGWQTAQDRLLRYLRALDVPPIQSLSLAQEALGRAMLKTPLGANPVEASMAALRALLTERGVSPDACLSGILQTPGRKPSRMTCGRNTFPAALSTAPPVNRGAMVSEDLDRKPWLSFFHRISTPVGKAATLVFNTQLQFLLFLIILVLLGPI